MLSALRHHRRLVLAFFLLAAAFLYLAHIGSYHLIELDEGRYHRIPMEMVLSGDYLTPHFDYMPYFEKPILQYWVTALAMKIFGFKEFTGRVLPALTGFGNVLLAYVLGPVDVQRSNGPHGSHHPGYVGPAADRRFHWRPRYGPDLLCRRLPGHLLPL